MASGPNWDASRVQPVVGSFTATGQSASFRPAAGRPFNASLSGTFVATGQLERSFDDGVTWLPCSRDSAGTPAAFTAPMSVVVEESEASVLYRLNCTAYTSGPIPYRLSQ
ncbi:hypothetical protein [Phenylobacterium sp.]|uniref:hypothetical protein n=1 Tax=Phenylobacterium sp. TaxID=1871053 RepID=UPI002731164E|nr:hypothetical protein [Phenylobacterium sp.]MDP1873649.1 hypothetical protein [Phenylobacterium sp.]